MASSDCSYLFDEVDGWLEVETKVNEFPLDSLPLVFLLLKDEHLWGAEDHHRRYHNYCPSFWSCKYAKCKLQNVSMQNANCFLDAIASPSLYPYQWVSLTVGQ